MQPTKISYLTHTWNPLAMRCTPVSAGCKNCWHLRMADRLAKNPKIPYALRQAYAGKVDPVLVQSRLEEPLKLKKPARIGLQFMGDLFHEDIADETRSLLRIFDIIALTPQHTYVILTKRPVSIRDWYEEMTSKGHLAVERSDARIYDNVWLGVSVENQKTADERIPLLLQIPAAVRFVSYEPALGLVDIRSYLWAVGASTVGPWRLPSGRVVHTGGIGGQMINSTPANELHWVICGAESGPVARPMDEDWVRDIRDQCVAAGVPLFYKQNLVDGKKILMPELDGRVWDQYPKEMK